MVRRRVGRPPGQPAGLQRGRADEPWDQPSNDRRRPRAQRELSMPATPSADGNLSGDTLLSLCINSKLLSKSNATMTEFNGKKGAAFDEWLTDVVSVLQAKGRFVPRYWGALQRTSAQRTSGSARDSTDCNGHSLTARRSVEDGPQRPSRTRWRVPVCRVAPGGTMGSAGNKGEPGRLCGWETDAPSLRSRVLPGGAI